MITSILEHVEYLVESDVDTLVVVGVETLDEVDTDEDVEKELEVDALQRIKT